jgi:hypothetical protein
MEQQTHHLKHSTSVTLSKTRSVLRSFQSLLITLYNDRTICCQFKQPGCLHLLGDRQKDLPQPSLKLERFYEMFVHYCLFIFI